MTPAADTARWTRGFVLAVLAYFTLQVVLRLALGGAYETDEAEMVAMTPGWQLGYGPQLPLYNWIQLGLFTVFGRDLFALALMKQVLLAGLYLAAFMAFRLWMPIRVAVAGALALMLVPDIAWEAERATTHSNIMLLAGMLCLWAVSAFARAGLARRAHAGHALMLGAALGIGGLSKYNFWLVPVALLLAGLSLIELRRLILTPRALLGLALAVLVAALLLAAPMAWLVAEARVALSSTAKLNIGTSRFAGLPDVAKGFVVLLLLPTLVWAISAARGTKPAVDDATVFLRWLSRAALIAAALTVIGVAAAGMGSVTSRWLLPVALLAAPALVMAAARRAPRAAAVTCGLALCLGLLVMAGLGYDRYKPGARRDVDFSGLPALVDAIAPRDVPVAVEFYSAGNLLRWDPERVAKPLLPFVAREFGAGPVLVLLRETTPRDVATALQQAGWPAGAGTITAEGAFDLPYLTKADTMPFRWALVEMPEPAP